jgi:hypothetical protein
MDSISQDLGSYLSQIPLYSSKSNLSLQEPDLSICHGRTSLCQQRPSRGKYRICRRVLRYLYQAHAGEPVGHVAAGIAGIMTFCASGLYPHFLCFYISGLKTCNEETIQSYLEPTPDLMELHESIKNRYLSRHLTFRPPGHLQSLVWNYSRPDSTSNRAFS